MQADQVADVQGNDDFINEDVDAQSVPEESTVRNRRPQERSLDELDDMPSADEIRRHADEARRLQ